MKKITLIYLFIIIFMNNLLFASTQTLLENKNLNLTKKEKNWIKEHPVIKAGNDSLWPPYDFTENNEAKGYIVDYLKVLSKIIGIKLEFVQAESWNALTDKFKAKEIDIISGFENIPENRKFSYFSDSFLTTYESIIMHKEDKFLSGYKDLYGKRVAIVKGYDYEKVIQDSYPQITLILVDSTIEGLKKVEEGLADAFLENNDVVMYLIKKEGFKNLKLAGDASFPGMEVNVDLQVAIRKDWPELYTILNKAIKLVPIETLTNLESKWLRSISKPSKEKIYLTREEQLRIKKNVAKVGGELNWKPFEFVDDDGKYQGIAKDIFTLISKKTGLKVEYVTGKPWKGLLSDIEAGEINILPAIYKSEEREKFITFTKPYLEVKDYGFMRRSDSPVESLFDIGNKKVAALEDHHSFIRLSNTYPNIDFQKVKSVKEGVDLLLSNEIDIFVEGYEVVKYYLSSNKIKTIKAVVPTDYPANSLHIGIHKENKLLAGVLNRALEDITEEELNKIFKKWFIKNNELNKINFTKKEKDWLKKNKTLTYSEVDWKPLVIINSNKMEGIIADYLHLIEKYTGITFVLKESSSWSEVLEKFKKGKIDFVPGIGNSQYEKSLGLISDVYATYPMTIITNEKINYVNNIDEIKDRVFSIPKYYTSYNFIKTLYPDIKIIETDSVIEALKNVSNGKADVFLGHLASSLSGMDELSRKNLKISGNAEFEFKHHFLISKEHPEFLSIVNKVFKNLTQKEKVKIYNDWVRTEVNHSFDYDLMLKIAGVFLLVLIIVVYYNRKITRKKMFVQTLINSQEQLIITTNGYKLINSNKAFLKFFNVNDEKEFRNKVGSCISETFDKYPPVEYLTREMKGLNWIDYILGNPNKVHKVRILKNNQYSVFSVTASLLPFEKKLMCAVFTDITEIERSREDIESIISGVLLPVIIITQEDERFLYLNKYAEKILKTSSEETLGKNTEDIFYLEGGKHSILELLDKDGFVKNYENTIYLTKDNTKFVALISVSKIKYLGKDSYIGMLTDITKMKEMENEILLSHKQTKDSIEYASLIQETIIPENIMFSKYFSDFFIMWKPKDIVGGDIYLFDELRNDDECLLMVIDCTGHGVPGAFVTMLVKAIERQIVSNINHNPNKEVSPSEILSIFNRYMKSLLKQDSKDSISNAGFDGGVIYYNKKDSIIKYSGAETSLYYIKNDVIEMIKGDRHSIGYKRSDKDYKFKEHILSVQNGMQFYITTDGYIDQNGGEKGFSLGRKKFIDLIEKNYNRKFENQKDIFSDALNNHQGKRDRNDDITLLGLKL